MTRIPDERLDGAAAAGVVDGGVRPAVAPPKPLNILLTNDDGYNAPGIQTLYAALVSAGYNVHVVAPAVNQSAQGSSLGGTAALNGPVAVTQFSPGNYYVDGRPATAALVGLDDLFAGNPPDLVISGTNRGDNIGESENISGTVNGALQALFEGVPSIAVSAGSAAGDYTAGFNNAAGFVVDFLHQLQAARGEGQPLLPANEALSVNVPGTPTLSGVSVTTVTPESTGAFPYAPTGPNTYAEGSVANTAPSGSSTAEGAQFLTGHVTISPLDGNWGATEAARSDLAVRLGSRLNPAPPARPLNILLLNEDGYDAPGITATRNALLAKGYNVTVLAPAADQSGVGSALSLSAITVTQYDAKDYAATGTPASLVALGLDPQGLFNGARPDLVVVGADQGDAVGIENSNHSATLGGAITALFNYGVPSIALTSASGAPADLATSAGFLTTLIGNLQASQGTSAAILPQNVGLSINVPRGADAANFAFTNIDGGTDSNLSAAGDAATARLTSGGAVQGTDPHGEAAAFAAGKITVSPIDGSTAVRDAAAYDDLAKVVGTDYGAPTPPPSSLAFDLSEDAYQGDAQFVVTVNGQQISGVQTATASHAAGQSQTISVPDFFGPSIDQVGIRFINDRYDGTAATDRNLYVSKLTVNGSAYQATDARGVAGPLPDGSVPLYGNSSVTFDTADTLTFRVAEDAYRGDAQFVVKVDGAQVGGAHTVTASHAAGQTQDIAVSGSFGAPRDVSVQFTNDAYGGTADTDRNLYVDRLMLNGALYQGQYARNDAGASGAQPAVLLGDGNLTFQTEDTLIFHVSEDAYQGDAQFAVTVNGKQVGGLHAVTASHAAGQVQDITVQGLFGDVHDVAISFANDAYGGTAATDRNLYVDGLTVNGTAHAADIGSSDGGVPAGSSVALLGTGASAGFHDLLAAGSRAA